MLKPNIARRASLGALLAMCFLSSPLLAGSSGDYNDRKPIKKWVIQKKWKKKDYRPPPSVPEPSSMLAGLAAGGALCGLAWYQRRRRP